MRTQTQLATRIQKLYKAGHDLSYDKIGSVRHPYQITNWTQSRIIGIHRLTLSEAHLWLDGYEHALEREPRPGTVDKVLSDNKINETLMTEAAVKLDEVRLERDIANRQRHELQGFAQHRSDCDVHFNARPCSCGLASLLKL